MTETFFAAFVGGFGGAFACLATLALFAKFAPKPKPKPQPQFNMIRGDA